jgi:hypothetical protein
MTPEEVAARTRLEQQAGRNAVRDTEAKPKTVVEWKDEIRPP